MVRYYETEKSGVGKEIVSNQLTAVFLPRCSEHSLDELVDELLSVSPSTTVLVGVSLGSETLMG